ncbi:SH3 domain containing protein [Cladophialophora carrionii]|uniref:SH3 domain containing protein n=1 Tax=Cladophialophora carrionii TaxID=86049 RepID=A0A1C1CVW4_9EURO|nr:SH3 domain containing protein [Cladophialophora carrionii]
MATPLLPTKFPCWCRAVYSWGGETDRDLGFVEGDLIECLNAGDGSWWMGRLHRDKRMMGLFPSNFVAVLGDDFVPMRRSVSPMPDLQKSDSTSKNPSAQLQEKKEKAKSRRPFSGYKHAKGPTTTTTALPKQAVEYDPRNPPSTVLWQQRPASRAPSRSPSPMPHHEIGSSPPPPPPPHRIIGGRAASPAPQPFDMNDRYQTFSRTPSPAPPSDSGHTPPMIRNAMDDVISSLDDMTLVRHDSIQKEPHQEFNPWSPEAFDDFRRPEDRPGPRPLTSLGLGAGGSSFSEARINYSSRHNSPDRFQDGEPRLENYVQRMESRLRRMQQAREAQGSDPVDSDPPEPPPKNSPWTSRPNSSMAARRLSARKRKSALDFGEGGLSRAMTQKTNSTNSSNGTNFSRNTAITSQSIMSGYSAGAFSATSAGSLARKRMGSIRDRMTRPMTSSGMRHEQWSEPDIRPKTPTSGVSFHPSHDSRQGAKSAIGWEDANRGPTGGLGGFTTPKAKKQGFFKKLIDTAKTGAASARSTISASQAGSTPGSPTKLTGIAGGTAFNAPVASSKSNTSFGRDAAREMGLLSGASADYILTRRDINRSNTPGPSERQERADRCHMLDQPVICPVEELYENLQGDEDADGRPVYEPFQLSNPSFSQVDKAARFITSVPSSITAATLATGFICRPYRSGVQRLRAIFIWCAERISWEDDHDFDSYQYNQSVDTRKVIHTKRGSSQEVATLVLEMCTAIGIHAEIVQGYLKTPGEDLDLDAISRPNHFWNALLVDNEWRMMDASLASPTNPKRSLYSSVSTSIAEAWYFLTRPSELCWTHVPIDDSQQHMIPNISPDVLLALPGTCAPFFRLGLSMHAYDTSIVRMEGLEMCTFSVNVPADVEVVAEVEARRYLRDQDGDVYEDGENVTKKRALTQASWYRTVPNTDISQKRYVVKAVLPGDEGVATLKVYAGKKGLMLSSRDIVHPLALALPLYHSGENPTYEFVMRHPTPHATRQDLYVVQPQCYRLGAGETYVFCVRQHAASVASTPATETNGFDVRPVSPNPMMRPASAMSMTSSAAGSNPSDPSSVSNAAAVVKVKDKPAKLAIQSPGGKIIRLNRKHEGLPQASGLKEVDGEVLGSVWETIVKVGEKGIWRGLVLADRSARWCVWGEWECV